MALKTKKKEEKKEVLTGSATEILDKLETRFGLKASGVKNKRVVSTGSYKVDMATNTGGYVLGKLVEIFGPESSGKSTITLHAIAEFQKAIPDKKVALFDYEHSFDKIYAQNLGIDTEKLLFYQPETQEQGYNMIVELINNRICSLIVIDSHTTAVPKKMLEGEMEDASYALQARNNSQFLCKIKGPLDRSDTVLLAISQLRANIGAMSTGGTPPAPITTGGSAFKFYSDMRFKIWKELDKPNELNKTTIDVVKNKCAAPFGSAVVDIEWGYGINKTKEIIDLAVKYKIMVLSGSWFSYKDSNLGQGASKTADFLDNNPELFEEIKEAVFSYTEPDVKETILEKAEVIK